MQDSVKTLVWYLSTTQELRPPIIELGSCPAPDQVGYSDMRPFFRDKTYIGCDVKQGPGVDRIEDAMSLSFSSSYAGTILCLDTIEHIEDPIRAVGEMYRVLSLNGILILTTHMWAPVHMPDYDYWRFTLSCMRDVLLKEFRYKEILFQGEESFPHNIIGLAAKAEENPFQIDLGYLNRMQPWPYPFPYQKWE